MMNDLIFKIILCDFNMSVHQSVLSSCVGCYSCVQEQQGCGICCLCCCPSTKATGFSNYLKMLLKNGEGKDPDSYWEFCYRVFNGDNVMILDLEEAETLYQCIKIKSSICLPFRWWTFLSVFLPLNIVYPFILLLPHLAQGEAISLLGHQHTKQSCVCVSL